ncbi:MAG: peptidoglycan-binding protein [Acidobacteria bacterium]|nr:peptidoglycan-binding protein [Acidobacteriota bacterium]
MQLLQEGDKGTEVKKLQTRLQELGFSPGTPDGDFGAGTTAALKAFQSSEGLLPDGVAGRKTIEALGFTFTSGGFDLSSVTVQVASKMLPAAPIGNIKTHLPIVLKALKAVNLADKSMVLMALSTIRAETDGFEPISEFKSKFNTSPNGQPFDLYDNRKDLGNQGKPDGDRFKGRGFIQLTGRANYQKHGKAIGLGDKLVKNPELANDPDIAAKLLASFLKSHETGIKQALLVGDLAGARRLVNGGSHGLEAFKEAFRTGEKLI